MFIYKCQQGTFLRCKDLQTPFLGGQLKNFIACKPLRIQLVTYGSEAYFNFPIVDPGLR
jgi:hypothetical protein